jgi:hypothetical protein
VVYPLPLVAEAVVLAQDFAGLIRLRQLTPLKPWLRRAATSSLTIYSAKSSKRRVAHPSPHPQLLLFEVVATG